MKNASSVLYEKNHPAMLRLYYDGPVPLNFCNPWFRETEKGKSYPFKCSGTVKLPSAHKIKLTTVFTASGKGSAVIGAGCPRHFEVFCNGRLCCSTLTEGTLYDALAPENHVFPVPVKAGKNTLEFFIEPGPRSTPFCCGVLGKEALKLPMLLYPPVHTHPGERTLTVIARTMGNIGCGMEYREKGSAQWNLLWDHRAGVIRRRTLHKFFLENLTPGALYEYRMVMIDPKDPDKKRRTRLFSFTAPPDKSKKDCTFFFTADPQFEPELQRGLLGGLLDAAAGKECDFLVFGGDINSRYSNLRVEKDLLGTIQKHASPGKTVIMLRGNHELRGPEPDAFADFWGDSRNRTYGMFRHGDTAFLVLDAWENRPSDHPRSKYYSRYNLDDLFKEEEKAFIRTAVNSPDWQNARRRIVMAHGAPFSHYDKADTMFRFLQELTDEFFCGKEPFSKVHLWFAGHTHIYTRSLPLSSEIAAFAPPRAPGKSGEQYIFPVFTGCGPNKKGLPQLSGFKTECHEDGTITVSSILPDGTVFEKIQINEDHSVKELISLPHFIPEPEL